MRRPPHPRPPTGDRCSKRSRVFFPESALLGELGSTISAKEGELAKAGKVYASEKSSFEAEEGELVNTVDELAGGMVHVQKGTSFVQVKQNLKPVMDVLNQIIEASRMQGAKKRGGAVRFA